MPVYLVQHGKCLAKEEDPQKGLSTEGRKQVSRIAEVAAGYSVRVAIVAHSGKKRARQTAEIMAEALKPTDGLCEISGIGPMDDVKLISGAILPGDNRMLVGHLPFMEKLIAYLVTGREELTVFRIQNGGIVCLDRDADQSLWHIKWALMPEIP